jgi:hypothetical protein
MNCRHFLCLVIPFAATVSAADPVGKIYPTPSQGTVSPSGKFTPAPPVMSDTSNVPRTAGDAQSLLKHVQKLEQTGTNTFRIGLVEFDKQRRTITVPATVCLRDQVVEYALVTTKGKAYESVLSTEASPVDVHLAMLLLGGSSVPVLGAFKQPATLPETNALRVEVNWQSNAVTVTVPLAQIVRVTNGTPEDPGRPMALDRWLYNGSEFDQWGFAAQREGSLVALIRDPAALLNNPGADRDNDQIHFPNAAILPAKGTPVRVVLRLPEPAPPPPPLHFPGVTPITPLSTNWHAP